jgi:hypothetical protein
MIDMPIDFDDDLSSERKVVLKRGRLYQKIKVVDDEEHPLPFKTLDANLSLKEGGPMTITAKANEQGLCQMTFPTFLKGSIIVTKGLKSEMLDPFGTPKRPDAVVNFTPDDLDRGHWLIIKIPKHVPDEFLIQGTVRDENGEPLEGVHATALFPEDHPKLNFRSFGKIRPPCSVILFL